MAPDCPAFPLPAPLAATLSALTEAHASLEEARLRYLLAVSIVVARRDVAVLDEAAHIRAELDVERETIAFHEARAIALALVDRVVEAAAPYLPANDAHDQAAE